MRETRYTREGKERVAELLSAYSHHLTPRELEILRRYYAIKEKRTTLSQLAKDMGVSATRIRQIRLEALAYLEALEDDPDTLRRGEGKRQTLFRKRERQVELMRQAKERIELINAQIAQLQREEGKAND